MTEQQTSTQDPEPAPSRRRPRSTAAAALPAVPPADPHLVGRADQRRVRRRRALPRAWTRRWCGCSPTIAMVFTFPAGLIAYAVMWAVMPKE